MAITIYKSNQNVQNTELPYMFLKGGAMIDESFESFNESNQFFKDLLEAVMSVRSDYYASTITDVKGYVEHVIAYEIYYQWSKMIDSSFNKYFLDDLTILRINGEIGKKYIYHDKAKYPDLVLHGGQDNKDHQEIVVEIKRYQALYYKRKERQWVFHYNALKEDLKKLYNYTNERDNCLLDGSVSPYKCGVFLVSCTANDMEIIHSFLSTLKNKIAQFHETEGIDKEQTKKIYCVISAENGSLIYFNLSNLSVCHYVCRTPDTISSEYKNKTEIIKRLEKVLDERQLNAFQNIVNELRFRGSFVDIGDVIIIKELKDSVEQKNKNAFLAMTRCCHYYGINQKFIELTK